MSSFIIQHQYTDDENKFVEYMQMGILRFIEDFKKCVDIYDFKNSHFTYENLREISKHPKLSIVNKMGDLIFYDVGKRFMAKPKSLMSYLLHPKVFLYDLSTSGWKIGFLRRLLKFDVDYNLALKILKHKS